MSAKKLYTQHKYIMAINALAQEQDVHIEVCTNFETFREIRKTQSDRPPLGPAFDASRSYVGPSNGFWLKGVNSKGQIIHTQAMRLLDLSNTTLAEHLRTHRLIYQPPNINPSHPKSFECLQKTADMTGEKVVYHGELWMHPEPRKYHNASLVALLTHFMLALASMQWAPDFVFGFMPSFLACKGLAAREGYMHAEPGVWKGTGDTEPFEEWIVWMNRDEIDYLMQFPPQNLSDMLQAAPRRLK